MINWLILVVMGVLAIASYLDVKYKAIPSVMLTGTLFAVLLLRHDNFMFGVYALVFALVIKDMIDDVAGLDFGMADIKILVIIGLLVTSLSNFIAMISIFVILQFAYTIIWRVKVSMDDKEMPFVPCLLAVFLCLVVLRGVA